MYTDMCERVLDETKARVVILVVGDGERGKGFSLDMTGMVKAKELPSLLRQMANEVERDIEKNHAEG